MRILVTNDDGIDSEGLHALAREMTRHGEVVVIAPDREFSGAGASLGHLVDAKPEAVRTQIDGIDEAWSLSGPPALCVLFARMGAFGDRFDLVVSGINPGNNLGRVVYHSGTVGAALTARNGGVTGLAVSQETDFSVAGQGEAYHQIWETAAQVAGAVVDGLIAQPPAKPAAINLNVPNVSVDELKGWRRGSISAPLAGAGSSVALEPKPGFDHRYTVKWAWGERQDPPAGSDTDAVRNGFAAITWLTDIAEDLEQTSPELDDRLTTMLGAD